MKNGVLLIIKYRLTVLLIILFFQKKTICLSFLKTLRNKLLCHLVHTLYFNYDSFRWMVIWM